MTVTETKCCTKCGAEKPLEAFPMDRGKPASRCKECRASYFRNWFADKREEVLHANSERYVANRDRYLAQQHRYRSENLTAIRAKERDRARADRDRKAARAKAWREQNPERFRAALRAWRHRNKDRHDALLARRRARLLDAFVADVDRRAIYERDEGRCGICGGHVPYGEMDLDHIKPLARGGTHEPANVQVAHRSCNRSKGAREV